MPLLRNSERSEFDRCRWSWDKAYNVKIKPIREKPALRFGTLIHKALEAYYKKGTRRGPHPAETFVKLYDEQVKKFGDFGVYSDDEWVEARKLGVDMLEHYVEHWGKDPAWKVLATEIPFRVPVINPRTKKLWFYSVGVIDLVIQDMETGMVGMADHKTTKDDPTRSTGYLTLDDQAGAYWRYGQQAIREAGLLPKGMTLDGIEFNFLRKAVRDTRPKNSAGLSLNKPTKAEILAYFDTQGQGWPSKMTVDQVLDMDPTLFRLGAPSKVQPAPYFHREPVYRTEQDGEKTHTRVLNQFLEMQMARNGKLAIRKSPNKMNCAGCGFRDLCEIDEMGQNWKPVAEATHQAWDPYGEHEIEDEGRGR